jgi:hypothetical protein
MFFFPNEQNYFPKKSFPVIAFEKYQKIGDLNSLVLTLNPDIQNGCCPEES